jgi:hypothetical protein
LSKYCHLKLRPSYHHYFTGIEKYEFLRTLARRTLPYGSDSRTVKGTDERRLDISRNSFRMNAAYTLSHIKEMIKKF